MTASVLPSETLLTLREAAERLGVHPATLRRWADKGDIEVRLTAGGHRRFPESAVARMTGGSVPASGDSPTSPHGPGLSHPAAMMNTPETEKEMTSRAITATRSEMRHHYDARWMSDMDEKEREEKRMLGRRLVGLMMQYVSSENGEHEAIISEARAIGRIYARTSLHAGLELSEALKATMFFRDNLVETAVLLPDAGRDQPEASARLYRKINEFLNAVQLAIAGVYDAKREAEE